MSHRVSTPISYDTRHMAGSLSNYFEPQRNNNFELQITGLNSIPDSRNATINRNVVKPVNGLNDASEVITLSVDTYSAPQININVINVPYGNNKIKFAGTPEFPDSSVSITDYIGLDVERLIARWQAAVYNPATGQIGYAASYKKIAYLLEYSPNGQQVRQWKLVGCWPSQLNLGEFSQDGNATRKIQMTITFDYAVPLNEDGNLGYQYGIHDNSDDRTSGVDSAKYNRWNDTIPDTTDR